MNIGPTVNVKGAKAIKLTRTLKKGGALGAEYSLEAYSVESIMSAAAAG